MISRSVLSQTFYKVLLSVYFKVRSHPDLKNYEISKKKKDVTEGFNFYNLINLKLLNFLVTFSTTNML